MYGELGVEKVPRYKFYGGNDDLKATIGRSLDQHDPYHGARELPKSSETIDRINVITNAWKKFGIEMLGGIDLLDRIPSLRQIKILTDSDYVALMRRIYPGYVDAESGMGETSLNGWMVVKASNSMDTFNHEMFHRICAQSFGINSSGELGRDFFGGLRADGRVFEGLNESLAELTANLVAVKYMGEKGHVLDHPGVVDSYQYGVIVLDSILNKLAEAQGTSKVEELESLVIGAIRGDFGVLKKITKVFGKKAMYALANFDPNRESSAKILAKDFGIWKGDVEEKFIAFSNQGSVEINIENSVKLNVRK